MKLEKTERVKLTKTQRETKEDFKKPEKRVFEFVSDNENTG